MVGGKGSKRARSFGEISRFSSNKKRKIWTKIPFHHFLLELGWISDAQYHHITMLHSSSWLNQEGERMSSDDRRCKSVATLESTTSSCLIQEGEMSLVTIVIAYTSSRDR